MVAFRHALLKKFMMNAMFFDNSSHGCNCSLKEILIETGLNELWTLMMSSWNLMYGYESDEQRLAQAKDVMKWTFENETYQTCYFYKAYFSELLADLGSCQV